MKRFADPESSFKHQDCQVVQWLRASSEVYGFLLSGEHEFPRALTRQEPDPGDPLYLLPLLGKAEHSAKCGEFSIDGSRAYKGPPFDDVILNKPLRLSIEASPSNGRTLEQSGELGCIERHGLRFVLMPGFHEREEPICEDFEHRCRLAFLNADLTFRQPGTVRRFHLPRDPRVSLFRAALDVFPVEQEVLPIDIPSLENGHPSIPPKGLFVGVIGASPSRFCSRLSSEVSQK